MKVKRHCYWEQKYEYGKYGHSGIDSSSKVFLHSIHYEIFYNTILFIFGRAGSSLPRGLFSPLVVASGDYSLIAAQLFAPLVSLVAEHRLQSTRPSAVEAMDLVVVAWALEHRLSSCDSEAFVDLPGQGIELVSPVLAGGFFTTELPGKHHYRIFNTYFSFVNLLINLTLYGKLFLFVIPSEFIIFYYMIL